MNIVQLMDTFVNVVRCGSFTKAADQLNLTTSMVSKQISMLERHLGSQLLNRTTRRLGLTDSGEKYFHSCTRILEDLMRAEQSIAGSQRAPQGVIKLRVPHTLAAVHITGMLSEFSSKYPGISVTMMIDQHSAPSIDFIARNFDLILHLGPISASTLTIRELAQVVWLPFASPDYLARRGTPRQPADLTAHNCLSHLAVSPDNKWELRSRRTTAVVKVSGTLNVNSVMVLRGAVADGIGIALLPTFCSQEGLPSGGPTRVLPAFVGPERNLHLAFVRDRMLPRRTSLLIDFLVERFRTPRWEPVA